MCRKRQPSLRCRSELIDSAWVVIVPDLTVSVDTGENSLQETVRKMTNTMEPMYYILLTDIEVGVIES